jgi:hypothetical protein
VTSVSPTPERSRTHSMVFNNAKLTIEKEGTYWLQVIIGNFPPFHVPFRVTLKSVDDDLESLHF